MTETSKGKNIAIWILQIFLAAGFIAAAAPKFLGAGAMVAAFDRIGWGRWFLYFTGVLEFVGGVCLLIPRLTFYAACLLAVIMAAATVFCLTSLRGQSPFPAIVFFLLSGAVAYFRKP